MSEAQTGKRSRVLATVAVLAAVILIIQAVAVVSVFWSRISFGPRFDPLIFSEFETISSTESVNETIGIRRAEEARREARRPVRDGVTLTMEKAGREREHARLNDQENDSHRGEAEQEAASLAQRGEGLLLAGLRSQAIEAFESALKRMAGHLPSIRRLASLYEQQGQTSQARFLWEKAGSVSGLDVATTAEIEANLKRLAGVDDAIRGVGQKPSVTGPLLRPSAVVTGSPAGSRLRIVGVTRTELPLQDLYDIRFRLEVTLDSEGHVGPIDIAGVRLEAVFFDQIRGADGRFRPVRVLPFQLQPRREWVAGEKQTLSLNYSVPRGYYRSKAMRHGDGYSFCGIMVKLYFRGELQDRMADPPSLASESGSG